MTWVMLLSVQGRSDQTLPMAGWPDWLVLVAAFFAIVVGVWVAMKLFKFALWLACILIVIFAVLAVATLLLR